MILVDLSTILWSNIHSQVGSRGRLDKDMIRHMILNSLRSVRSKYGQEYGELVICADGRNYWRKKDNPYYKSQRKKARDKSKLDMKLIFDTLTELKDDIRTTFPYKIIEVDRAEADDLVGAICRHKSSPNNPILIYSSDKDFYQLQRYPNVTQISPMTKKPVKVEGKSPIEYLAEHIIRGDSGDGVCNILSPIDTLATEGKRQKPVSKKKLAEWANMTPEEICADAGVDVDRYYLNKRMVDLSETPQEIVDEILKQFELEKSSPIGGWGNKILSYFMKHRMKVMTDYLSDFVAPVRTEKIPSGGLESFL